MNRRPSPPTPLPQAGQGSERLPAAEADTLRQRAEARLREQRAVAGRRPSAAENQRLIHELQVHQIELEMQNQALLELHQQLEQSLEQYTELHDFAPVGYLTLAGDGAIQEVNLAGAALLGMERAHLIDRRFGAFVAVEARPTFNAFLERVRVGTNSVRHTYWIDKMMSRCSSVIG